MLPSPSSSPRPVLAPCTNTLRTPPPKAASHLPTPPVENKGKRRHVAEHKKPQKRLKVELESYPSESEEDNVDSDEDTLMEDIQLPPCPPRRDTPYRLLSRFVSSPTTGCRRMALSTLPILQSFVSSNKSDVYKCQSIGDDTFLTPPYACSYSEEAKAGRIPLLAVATEQGTVHIIDTSKRKDWDCEPPRKTLQPHNNGVFDVKWNMDGTSVGTCSGDQTTRVSSVETGAVTNVLRGHSSTVKCMAWDPNSLSLLTTGGRDGAICLWDLRIGQSYPNGLVASIPVMTLYGAHEDTNDKSKPKPRGKSKQNPTPRTITNVLYPESHSFSIISSSSFDGVLRSWDLRSPDTPKKKTSKLHTPPELYSSIIDPTTRGSRRARGILSLALGTGPSAGLIFAFGADSRIHTYDLPTLSAHSNSFSHNNLQTNSFYVGLSVSPCGRWLGCGGSPVMGNSFIFDVEKACRPGVALGQGVELKGQKGEVGCVDWAHDALATCADDGTVRLWRPDLETHIRCREQPEDAKWDWTWSI